MTSPWEGRQPPRREPIFNMPLIVTWTAVLLLVLYFLFTLLPERTQLHVLLDYAFIPARFGGLPPEYAAATPDSVAWGLLTMITHTGLHGGWVHVIFNVAWLVAFGTIVARVAGGLGFVAIFIAGAIAGAGVFWAVHPADIIPVVGASGAISALMGAASRFFFGPGPVALTNPRLLGFTAVWMVINLVFGLTGFEAGGQSGQIAWEAHVGGFFAGLLLIPYFVRPRPGRA